MSRWFRLDCDAFRHPKVASLTDEELRVWLEAIAYCAEHGTNGILPEGWLKNVARRPKRIMVKLVKQGLVVESQEGTFALHDYLDHQPDADYWSKRSDAARKAAEARWGDRRPGGNAERNANGNANGNATITRTNNKESSSSSYSSDAFKIGDSDA
jgi:hypothetical protein